MTTDSPPATEAQPAKRQFKRWMSAAPRPHGAVIRDRAVSNLELFYDLVYVAIITQAANRLTADVSARGFLDFVVVFAMTWIAWINGTLYIELHGREDGRTRLLVFLQMGVLALLAVFTQNAAGASGQAFALVYAAYLALMTWQWNIVRELDRADRPEFLPITAYYVGGMVLSTLVIGASAFLPVDARLAVWGVYAALWLVGIYFAGTREPIGITGGILPTESLVERFGLFTIIVLGEVIFGVVEGLSGAPGGPSGLTIVTGSLALIVGFGFWWVYFDLVGNRLPREGRGTMARWTLAHLPIQLSIAAAGAAMVSLIEHAADPTTPPATAWLLAGAVAIGLLGLIPAERSLADAIRLASVYRPLTSVLALSAAIALAAGFLALA
ncbi:MAG TPA: low temperature requirement protein A, partial [Candidatus Limnocylindrales bacterium]|nr:low temperature requirement protein A [Candidatus Limnocylindrales bacterium]